MSHALGAQMRGPNDIISCMTIPEDHFLKTEALAVRDAFESVTNGMVNPSAMAELEALGPHSVFTPWKNLILAIQAFYAGDHCARDAHSAAIAPGSFPARVRGLWALLDHRARAARAAALPGHEGAQGLADAVYPPSDSLGGLLEEIRESLDEGLEDYFLAASGRLIRELLSLSAQAAARAALGILAEVDARGMAPDAFLKLLRQLFGEVEGLRLTALYLADSRPGLSLLFWLKAAATALDADPDREELAAWLLAMGSALERLRGRIPAKGAEQEEMERAMRPLLDQLASIASRFQPPSAPPARGSAFQRLEALRAACLRAGNIPEVQQRRPVREGPPRRARTRNQLELFVEHGS